MYTLYYMPGACSLAVHTVLREIGAKFELKNVKVPDGQPRPAEYLAINPRGSVPTLVEDGTAIREGAAILTYLIDKHKSPLLPREGLARAKALEWLCTANATLHPLYSRCFFMNRTLGDAAASNPMYTATIQSIQKLWDEIEATLANGDYLCGNDCTVADILVTVIANWTPAMRQPINLGPRTKALFSRVIARPAYQDAMKAEEVTYKVAA